MYDGINFENRDFKVWYTTVSLGIVLLRSPKDNKHSQNLDIVFFNVEYLEVPCLISNLVIEKANIDDINYLKHKFDEEILTENIHVFLSNGKKYYIIGILTKVQTNDLELFELPFEKPNNM